MAEEIKNPNNKETKMPVFAVLKNGAVVKNIFLNNPQWVDDDDRECSDREECPVLIGRHPDCHIVLDHPSISRFHLDIRAEPASMKLSVTDLSSVHGTWVSGNKIQPNISVDLTEGDTIKLGASTRVYRLHWIPLSSAFEMENPLPAVLEENEETHPELLQMENTNQVFTEEIPSAPPLPLESENQSPLMESMTPMKNFAFEMDNPLLAVLEENRSEVRADEIPSAPSLPLESENWSPLSLVVPISECEGENLTPVKDFSANEVKPMRVKSASSLLSRRSKSKSVSFLRVQTGRSERKNGESSRGGERGKGEETFCRALFSELDGKEEEEETYVSDKENMTPLNSTAQKLKRNTAVTEPGEEETFVSDKENMTPLVQTKRTSTAFAVLSLEHVLNEDNTISTSEALSSLKRNKPVLDTCAMNVSGNKLRTSFEEENEDVLFYSDKENVTPGATKGRKSKKLCSKSHNAKERVPFQSLLENSPSKNGCPLSNVRRTVDKERAPFQSLLENSPSKNSSPLGHRRRPIDKERFPFQSVMEKSPLRNASPVNYAHKLGVESEVSSVLVQSQCMDQGEKKVWNWNMVVDAECLLNEESRKSLQLLEGLKGTHLIIPRIVIRELDCLKRREGLILYRKERKAASSALQWIEECMVKCSRWIHVQSSSETLPVPPTPPATPRPQSADGKEEFWNAASSSTTVFSTCGSLMEIVSPTAEDHILDCALLFKAIRDNEQFVLLSDSITLKIKAMAEGLICESAKEFHASLVNPYSKRFLWTSSSPRGSTWSCVDEVALIEKYTHQFPAVGKLGKPTDDVKGLKLILLHNAHYGKTNLVKY